MIIAITAVILALVRFDILDTKTIVLDTSCTTENLNQILIQKFKSIQSISLQDVIKIEYPFSDDPDDFYTIYLKDREIQVNQVSGGIIKSVLFPKAKKIELLSYELHTGSFSAVWAFFYSLAA